MKECESSKSVTTDATDLGEEVQVDDACDVRPVVSTLSFHSQTNSLAYLQLATSLWNTILEKVNFYIG